MDMVDTLRDMIVDAVNGGNPDEFMDNFEREHSGELLMAISDIFVYDQYLSEDMAAMADVLEIATRSE